MRFLLLLFLSNINSHPAFSQDIRQSSLLFEGVFKYDRPSDGGIHTIVLKNIDNKSFGTYYGCEVKTTYTLSGVKYDTLFYSTPMNNLLIDNEGNISFNISTSYFTTHATSLDSNGNVKQRGRYFSKASPYLNVKYRFWGSIAITSITLKRTSDFYFSRFDQFNFIK